MYLRGRDLDAGGLDPVVEVPALLECMGFERMAKGEEESVMG